MVCKTMAVVPALGMSIPARDVCTGMDALKPHAAATTYSIWTSEDLARRERDAP